MVGKTNSELREKFEKDGFVLFPSFFDAAAMAELTDRVDRFVQELVPRLPGDQVFFENKDDARTLKQIQQMGNHDPWFDRLFRGPQIRGLAEFLLAGAVVPKNMQYFNKPAGVGLATPPHQDGYYFMLDPCKANTMWLALDEVDEQNGCVRYVRGSHRSGMRVHTRTQTLGFSQGIVDYPLVADLECEVAMLAQPGDLLVHDAMTVHRADGNLTLNRSRRALGFIFYSENAREDEAAHAAYQQCLTDEMEAANRI